MMKSLRQFFSGRKDSQARTAMALFTTGRPVASPRNYEGFAKEGYANQVIAFRSIAMIADAVAGLEFGLYKKASRGEQDTEVTTHAILDLLDKPNPLQSRAAFLQSVTSYLQIAGNSYIEASRPNDPKKPPMELWSIRADRWEIEPGVGGIPAAYIYKASGGSRVRFPVDIKGRSPICHLKTFNPLDDWYGQSPMEAAAAGVDNLNASARWNLALLQNSARPSGAFTVKTEANTSGELTPDQRATLRQDIEEMYSGVRNSGRPMLLEGGLQWTGMSFSPVDMDFLNSKKVNEKDVAQAFGVPPQMVGIEGSQTFANYEQARIAFYTETVIPIAQAIFGYLNRWLVPMFLEEGLYLKIDFDSIEALAPIREKKWDRIEKSTILTVNEKREALGYSRYKTGDAAGDQILVASSLVPLEAAALPDDEPMTDLEDLNTPPAKEPVEDEESDETDPVPPAKPSKKKHLNLKGRARRLHWVGETKKMRTFERAMVLSLKGAFRKEGEMMADALSKVDKSLAEFTVNSVIARNQPTMEKLFQAHMREVLLAFGHPVLDMGKSYGGFESKDAHDRYEAFIRRFLDSAVVSRVKAIGNQTRTRVLRKIREVFADGAVQEVEYGAKINDTVVSVYANMEKSRVITISRTEVHNAATMASREAAKELRIPGLKKEWISSPDERTREAHRELDGVKVGIDDKFEVKYSTGVDLMDGPGDNSATAENVINCRCTLTYSTESGGNNEE